jgi:hypothetical protein
VRANDEKAAVRAGSRRRCLKAALSMPGRLGLKTPDHQPLKRRGRLTVRGRKGSLRPLAARIDRMAQHVHADPLAGSPGARRGGHMFDLRDLFQWERFITPSIIKVFYLLAVIIMVLVGLSGILSGLLVMMLQPLSGLFMVVSSVLGMLAGVILVRILSEFVLITFRINEHLGAMRNRGQM